MQHVLQRYTWMMHVIVDTNKFGSFGTYSIQLFLRMIVICKIKKLTLNEKSKKVD